MNRAGSVVSCGKPILMSAKQVRPKANLGFGSQVSKKARMTKKIRLLKVAPKWSATLLAEMASYKIESSR